MSFNLIATLGIVLVFVSLAIVLLMPAKVRSKRKFKKSIKEEEPEKDWHAVSRKLERHIKELREDLSGVQRDEKKLDRDLMVQKEKYKKLQEKLEQERGWKKKETGDLEKKNKFILQFKEDIRSTEQKLNQEHKDRLRLEREIKDAQKSERQLYEDKKQLETDLAKGKNQIEEYRKENTELRAENAKLSKQHNDATWIAKSEYTRLEKELFSAQKELSELKELIRRKGFD